MTGFTYVLLRDWPVFHLVSYCLGLGMTRKVWMTLLTADLEVEVEEDATAAV